MMNFIKNLLYKKKDEEIDVLKNKLTSLESDKKAFIKELYTSLEKIKKEKGSINDILVIAKHYPPNVDIWTMDFCDVFNNQGAFERIVIIQTIESIINKYNPEVKKIKNNANKNN